MWNKRRWFALVVACGLLIMAPASGLGSGFALYEAGARSSALGCAMVARADDLSAMFYNPAGLSMLPRDKGWEVNLLNLSAEANDDGLQNTLLANGGGEIFQFVNIEFFARLTRVALDQINDNMGHTAGTGCDL